MVAGYVEAGGADRVEGVTYERKMIAQMAGVAVYEVVAGKVPGETVRQEIYRQTLRPYSEYEIA